MQPLRYDPETNTILTNLAFADLSLLVGQWATESEGALAAIMDRIETSTRIPWRGAVTVRCAKDRLQGRLLSQTAAST